MLRKTVTNSIFIFIFLYADRIIGENCINGCIPHAQGKRFTGLLLLGAGLGPQLKVLDPAKKEAIQYRVFISEFPGFNADKL